MAAMFSLAAESASGQGGLGWEVQDSGVVVGLRGLWAVSERVAWATGAEGTWLRTVDGGASWQHGRIPGAEALGVRDVHAFDDLHALVLTIASPGRIYRTVDGGANWEMVFEDARPEVFFNCMDFADDRRGYAVGDPIDGRFLLIETVDGGESWTELSALERPDPTRGEAQFAASGTCLQAKGENLWIGTGGSVARVFRSKDRGRQWTVSETPLQQGTPSAGVFSVLFWNETDGIVVGGDYRRTRDARRAVALTTDGGETWTSEEALSLGGFRSAVVSFEEAGRIWLVAVGPDGTDVSSDAGRTWVTNEGPGFHVVSIAPDGAIWAAGPDGRVARLIHRP